MGNGREQGVSESGERAQKRAQEKGGGWWRVRRGLAGGVGTEGNEAYARACRNPQAAPGRR